MDHCTNARGQQVRTVIAFAAWLIAAAAIAQNVPSNFRAYPLRHAKAAETAARLRQALVQSDAAAQVLVDPETNQLIVNGSDETQSLAAKLLATFDQPAVEPSATRNVRASEVKGYRVADPHGVASQLQALFPPETGARIVVDDRTQQVIVVAPSEVQRAIANRVNGEKPTATEPANAQPLGQEPMGTTYRLQNIQAREFEEELHRLWGNRLRVTPSQNGDEASIFVTGDQGPQKIMQIDRLNDRITFSGTGRTVATWRSFVNVLDAPRTRAEDVTQLISLQNADPRKIQEAVSLMGSHGLKGDDATATVQLGGKARPRNGNDLVSMIFQQAGEQAQPNQPAAKPGEAPAANPNQPNQAEAPGEAPVADVEGGALIGPVQIEIIEGLDVIVIRGHKRDVARVQKIIEDIERYSLLTQPVIEVHQLMHVNSESMQTLVSEIYTEILSPRQGQVSIRALVEPNALLLIGRAESVAIVRSLIEKLDQPIPPTSRFEVFRLKHVSAVDAEQTVRNFFVTRPGFETNVRTGLGARIQLIADYRTNTLIVQASPRDLEEVRRFVETIDVEGSDASTQLRIFKLKNAIATDLATVLQSAISGQATTTGGQQGQQQPQQQGGGGQQGGTATANQSRLPSQALELMLIDQNGGKLLKSGILSNVVVTAEPSTNALVVRAPAASMSLVAALIEQLDKLPDASAQIKVFTIVNGDATSLTTMLQQLFGQTVTAGTGNTQGLLGLGGAFGQQLGAATAGGETSLVPLRFAVDLRTNSIIASGSESDLQVVETILLRLDEDLDDRKLSVVRLRNTQAVAVATAIQTYLTNQQQRVQQQLLTNQAISPFETIEREVFVVAEEVTNSLIVSATPKFYEEIMRVITDLDVRPPMVMVQVLIAEVSLGNTFEFGTEFGLQDSLVFDRGKAVGATAETVSTPGFNFNSSPLAAYPNVRSYQQETVAGQSLTNFALGRSSTAMGYSGLVLSAANESVNMLLRALQDEGRSQILSRPQVMTIHNQPAYVQVGADVARITGTNINQSVVTQEIEDRQTGIILSILPLINDDGVIVLGVEAERSAIGPLVDGTPIGNGVIVPPVNVTRANTTISARDGQTVVFAGLITKSNDITLRRVPYLCDIPVLGRLFEFESSNEQRTELLIVMTPYIIRDEADIEMAKLRESERMSWCLADVVNVAGDWGLQGNHCAFCKNEAPVIFPDVDPTATKSLAIPAGHVEKHESGLQPVPEKESASMEQPVRTPPTPSVSPATYQDTPTRRLPSVGPN
jgi:general secretion pathway protein D